MPCHTCASPSPDICCDAAPAAAADSTAPAPSLPSSPPWRCCRHCSSFCRQEPSCCAAVSTGISAAVPPYSKGTISAPRSCTGAGGGSGGRKAGTAMNELIFQRPAKEESRQNGNCLLSTRVEVRPCSPARTPCNKVCCEAPHLHQFCAPGFARHKPHVLARRAARNQRHEQGQVHSEGARIL